MKALNTALFGLALLALGLGACNGKTTTKGDPKGGGGSQLSGFVAEDLEGNDFDLGDHLGKDVILISFWATYCEPCKVEMPVLQKMHDSYGDKGLKILSVSLDGSDTSAGVRPYIKTNKYTFTCVIDEDTSIANAYNPRATAPYTIIIDRQGKVFKTIEGFQLSEAAALEAEVKHLLAGK